jgi:predicted dehydrogenase
MVAATRKKRRLWILAGPYRREGDFAWIADLPAEIHELTDSNAVSYVSRLQLCEDAQLLGPAHSLHQTISTSGRGAYSFWQSTLYFSTSDGSDPNLNGRVYKAILPELQPPKQLLSSRASWSPPAHSLRCAVIGMGNRGVALASLASSLPGVEIAWCVDKSEQRLAEATRLFGARVRVATDVRQTLADEALDVVFVTVPDHLHRDIAESAFRASKHVFLEKPVATTVADAKAILAAWQQSGRVLQLGYVLRQAPFYAAIREVVRQRLLGPIRTAILSEQLEVRHGAAFMRRWHANSSHSGGLLVHKGCHDLDVLCWLLDAQPIRVASFGGMTTFNSNPPAPFCSQCPERARCRYVDTALHERRSPAEAADPTAYGLDRCVFHLDKDIVDNQVVSFELDNGTRGSFSLDGIFEDGRFQILFTDKATEPLVWTADPSSRGGHGGGDRVTMVDFFNACSGRSAPPVSDPDEAIRGLVFALAAEEARKSGSVVTLGAHNFAL